MIFNAKTNVSFLYLVTYSYCVDSENRHLSKAQQQQNNINNSSNNVSRRDQHQNAPPPNMTNEQLNISPANGSNNGGYQYTMADVPKLAEQAATMYATSPAEKQSYFEYYKDFYTKQVSQNQNVSVV